MSNFSADCIRLLRWNSETGIGYFPVDEYAPIHPYNDDYFNKYKVYETTDLGKQLTDFRLKFVDKHWKGALVDVGVGSGQFLRARSNTKGYDINPAAISMLQTAGAWHDILSQPCVAASFWDSLEHIRAPSTVLKMVTEFVFVSIPVFNTYDQILRSVHFRPDEHYWYFSPYGFVSFMWNNGFRVLETSDTETHLGRSSITSFAFRRR